MRKRFFYCIILVCGGLIFGQIAQAQSKPIKVKFEVDGKENSHPFRIEISHNGIVIKSKIADRRCVFPPEFIDHEKVDLRFISVKYDLLFEGVYLAKFQCDMVFGVDNKPCDKENIPTGPLGGKELRFIYYVRFEPETGDGTTMTVSVYK